MDLFLKNQIGPLNSKVRPNEIFKSKVSLFSDSDCLKGKSLNFLGFLLISFLFLNLIGCQHPVVRVNTLTELPEALNAGFNGERWYFADFNLRPPFAVQKNKKINGLANPFIYAIDQKLILTTFNGYLISLNRQQLNDVDRIHLARGISVPPAFSRPLVFVSAEKGKYGLQAYDLMRGKILWKKRGLLSHSSPLVRGNVVFHADLKGAIFAFNGLNGKELWQYESRMPIINDLALHGDSLVAVSPDGIVLCLNGLDGSLLWKTKIEHHLLAAPMILKGKIYLADLAGNIQALNLADGQTAFAAHTEGVPFYQPCTTDGKHIFAMNSQGGLYCFTSRLEALWNVSLSGVPTFPVFVSSNLLLVGTAQKHFYLIDKSNGRMVQDEVLKHRLAGLLPFNAHLIYLILEEHYLSKWQSKGVQTK